MTTWQADNKCYGSYPLPNSAQRLYFRIENLKIRCFGHNYECSEDKLVFEVALNDDLLTQIGRAFEEGLIQGKAIGRKTAIDEMWTNMEKL